MIDQRTLSYRRLIADKPFVDLVMAEANAVTLKLPNFWTTHPKVWFAKTEAQFHLRSITADLPKYHYVVAALDQDVAGRLVDILRTPPENDKYANIKVALLRAFGLIRRDLLDLPGLGNGKPSTLLAEMRALSDGHTLRMLFEELFLRQMPDDIRMQLAQQDFSDLNAVAERADALWQAKTQGSDTFALNPVGIWHKQIHCHHTAQ